MKHKVLIIDDEISVCESLRFALESDYEVRTATSPEKLGQMLDSERIDVVLLDLRIGPYNGIDVLKDIKKLDPTIAVLMMTAYGSESASIEAIRLGAFKYLAKPIEIDELLVYIGQALELQRLSDEVTFLSGELRSQQSSYKMIGSAPAMKRVYDLIDRLKDIDTSVIVLGESGTGKELVARAIHFSGRRRAGRFVAVNCAAIPEGLLEEEFFGHRKGSFTGAVDNKLGKLAVADGGTLFLDEIGDMPLSLQGKLLRVFQDKEFIPIGSNMAQKTDLRVIAATNRDLRQMVREGSFREDLYYRLSVMDIALPPLRDRKGDIPALCQSFIEKYNAEQKKAVKSISQNAQRLLIQYDYPGNVRQLANIIEHAMILTPGDVIDTETLPEDLFSPAWRARTPAPRDEEELPRLIRGMTLKQLERVAIQTALADSDGRKAVAAKKLGISERGLWYKIKDYELV